MYLPIIFAYKDVDTMYGWPTLWTFLRVLHNIPHLVDIPQRNITLALGGLYFALLGFYIFLYSIAVFSMFGVTPKSIKIVYVTQEDILLLIL